MSGKTVPIEKRLQAVLYHKEHTNSATQKKFPYSIQAINKWTRLYEETGSVADPPANRGRKRKLSPCEEKRMVKIARKEKGITNVALARRTPTKIVPRTVSNILKRSGQKFTTKLTVQDAPKTFTQQHKEEGKTFINKVKKIKWDRRVYVDETWLDPSVSRKRRRVPVGETIEEPALKTPKLVIPLAIRLSGPLKVTNFFEKRQLTDDDFEKWVKSSLCPLLKKNDVVIWDQLGKYGREKNPYRLHWSQKAQEYVEARGATVLMLPSFGKLHNPIELYIRACKEKYRARLANKNAKSNDGKITSRMMKLHWNKAEKEMKCMTMHKYFQQRANGQEFLKVCSDRGLL